MGYHWIKMPFETNIQMGHFGTFVFQTVQSVSGVYGMCMQKLNDDY